MPTVKIPLGLDAKLYRNNGAVFLAPASFTGAGILEVGNVKDLTLSLDKATADVSTRGNGGWGADVGTLKRGNVEFDMVADAGDANYVAIRNAWLNNTAIQFGVLSGPLTTPPLPGSEGLVAVYSINSMTRAEPLEGAQMVSVSMTPTYVSDTTFKPGWITIAGV